jgi:primosomal protein N' (replication factor Y)
MRPVHVALPIPLWQDFTYLAPKTIHIGTVVQVSFGSRIMWGIVWKDGLPCPGAMKTIASVHPFLKLSPQLMQFIDAMARYILCPLGLIIKMVLPPAIKYDEMGLLEAVKKSHSIALDLAHAPETKKIVTAPVLDPHYVGTLRQWSSHQGISLVAARSLVRSGALAPPLASPPLVSLSAFPSLPPSSISSPASSLAHSLVPLHKAISYNPNTPDGIKKAPLVLSPLQEKALEDIREKLRDFQTIVLEGITGSGKTEVLLALCESIWARGEQVLVLLPEIMLSYPWCQRVEKYFDVPVTLWHSAMSPRLRQEGLESIILGKTPLIIGARSALCLPYAKLGLMVVDEEHEAAYKQTDSVHYHGRDMAVLRGRKEGVPVILASATPSIETRWNVLQNRYGHVRMHHRYGAAQLPTFSCIDMRPHPPKENAWISPALRKSIQETLDKGEQSLVFLNRRGYACLWMCYRCGYRAACNHCSAWLTVHEKPPQLLCHYCGYIIPVPPQCPGCGDDQGLLLMGPGIERIAKEIIGVFPSARTVLLSSDHVTSASHMKMVLDQITNREIDILIGTQLIAKGYHFPYLTCIGIVDTDFSLADMDFRASERLFQLLYQVAGRAGRENRPGQVFLQTMQPDYPLFHQVLSYDWDTFVGQEIAMRQAQDCPPIARFTAIILSHVQEWSVQEIAMQLQKKCPKHGDIQVFGPAPSPLSPLRGRYRWRFLIKSKPSAPVYAFIRGWIYAHPLPPGVLVEIDRDPYSLL